MASIDDYIKSEKFIWDDLIKRGELAVKYVKDLWVNKRDIPRFLISFPAEHVQTPNGIVTHAISFVLPNAMPTFEAAVELAKETKAYALLLVEKKPDAVKIILESHHGTRCWTLPIVRHGDRDVLKKEEVATDAENIGVLWRPLTARS